MNFLCENSFGFSVERAIYVLKEKQWMRLQDTQFGLHNTSTAKYSYGKKQKNMNIAISNFFFYLNRFKFYT